MNTSKMLKLIVSIALPLTVGAVAGMFTSQAIPDWYAHLNKPFFNPPNWIFAPVWTTLYILMGISAYMIWALPVSKARNAALSLFVVQLVLNFIWSFLFFHFKMIGVALLEIVVLWAAVLAMILYFRPLKLHSAQLNLPYLSWVSFATLLNAAYWWLN